MEAGGKVRGEVWLRHFRQAWNMFDSLVLNQLIDRSFYDRSHYCEAIEFSKLEWKSLLELRSSLF